MNPEDQIRALQKRFKSVLGRMPRILGNEVVNFTLDNFQRQGFLGNSFEPWAKRKEGWGKDNRKGRAVLTNTGRLRRSVRIVQATQDMVVIGTDVPYAKAHNEGLRIGLIQTVKSFTRKSGVEVKAHTRRVNQNIPRRKFMGKSPYLEARLKRVTTAELMKELKRLK
jgi:phage gpG-like protein